MAEPPRSMPAAAAPTGEAGPQIQLLRSKWRLISEELKREKKVMIAAALVDTLPERFEADTLVIAFPTKTMAEMFTSRGKVFSDPLSGVIQRLTGVQTRVRAEFSGSKPPANRPTAKVDSSAGAPRPTSGSGNGVEPPRPSPSPLPGAGGSELIHNVLDVFDGRIVEDHES